MFFKISWRRYINEMINFLYTIYRPSDVIQAKILDFEDVLVGPL